MNKEMKCLYCGESSQVVPLINVTYKNQAIWICSQHLPVLIHHPEQLEQQLEDALDSQD